MKNNTWIKFTCKIIPRQDIPITSLRLNKKMREIV